MLRIEPFERLPKVDVGSLKEEAARLIRFVEPDAETHEVTVARPS